MQQENKERLEKMAMDYLNSATHWGDEDSRDDFKRGIQILEKLRDIEETEMNAENQAERIQVEREKIDSQERCEDKKQDISWKRIALDVITKFGPQLIATGGLIYLVNKTGKFEETGRWNSQASRLVQNQAPKIMPNLRN